MPRKRISHLLKQQDSMRPVKPIHGCKEAIHCNEPPFPEYLGHDGAVPMRLNSIFPIDPSTYGSRSQLPRLRQAAGWQFCFLDSDKQQVVKTPVHPEPMRTKSGHSSIRCPSEISLGQIFVIVPTEFNGQRRSIRCGASGSMLRTPGRNACHDNQAPRSAKPDHVAKCLDPIWVVLHGFTRNDDIETVVRRIVLLPLANHVHTVAIGDIESNVVTVMEKAADRPVDVQRTNLENATIVEEFRQSLSEQARIATAFYVPCENLWNEGLQNANRGIPDCERPTACGTWAHAGYDFSLEMLNLTACLSVLVFGLPRAAPGRCHGNADTFHAEAIAPTHAELHGYLKPKHRRCANATQNS